MKRFLLSVLAVLMVSAGWSKCLCLTLSDGTQVYYQLGGETNPMLRVGEEGLTLDADSYSFTGIVSFKILNQDAPDDLHRVNSDMQSDGNVRIFSLDGKEVSSETLPAGIYVMKSEKAKMKIVKQ